MTEPLLTIGAFARAVDLTPSALRYYDEAGVLIPAEVDPHTGYRYYTPAMQHRAQIVRRMREIGVPVETMRQVLDSEPDRAAELLAEVAERAAASARRAAEVVADVVASLRAARTPYHSVTVSVDGPELAVALSRVRHAASTEPGSPLGVLLLDVADDAVTVVATDRYWLAMWSVPLTAPHGGRRRAAVPLEEVAELVAWLSRQDTVTLCLTSDELRVRGAAERVVPLVDDRFPAYRVVLDDQPAPRGRVTVDREAWVRLLRDHAASQVRLAVGRDRITVCPWHEVEGRHLAAITVGAPATLGFSSALLRTALTAMAGPTVTMWYAAPDRAVRVSSAYQRRFTALVMPVRLDR